MYLVSIHLLREVEMPHGLGYKLCGESKRPVLSNSPEIKSKRDGKDKEKEEKSP
jgi:hypothetical protein